MTALLLNPRVLLSIAIAILLGWAGIHLYRAGEASVQQKWDAQKWDAQKLADAEAARAEEARRTAATQKVIQEAQDAQKSAQADADAARQSSAGLQRRIAALVAASNSAAAAGSSGQQGGDTLGVLADLLNRIDERQGIVAAYADQLRIAGQGCEAAYQSLTAK